MIWIKVLLIRIARWVSFYSESSWDNVFSNASKEEDNKFRIELTGTLNFEDEISFKGGSNVTSWFS
jgi:hypothetical protein